MTTFQFEKNHSVSQKFILIVNLIFLRCLIGCSQTNNNTLSFDNGDLSNWKIINPEYGSSSLNIDSIVTRSENSRFSLKYTIENIDGKNYERPCINQGEVKNSCRHLEIRANESVSKQGAVSRFKWSFFFEKLPKNRVAITLMQIKTQHGNGGSPVIQLRLRKDYSIQLQRKEWVLNGNNERILNSEQSKGLRRIYHVKNNKYSSFQPIKPNQWYDIEMTIKWSSWENKPTGFIHLKLKNEFDTKVQTIELNNVSTMNSDNQKFQLGAYWGRKGPSETIFYIDNVMHENLHD